MASLAGLRAVLEAAGEPLHTREITKRMLDQGLWQTEGKTPEATVAARLYADTKKKGDQSVSSRPARAPLR